MALLIDELHLRRAAMAALLEPWSRQVALSRFEAVASIDGAQSQQADWAIVILNVGTRRMGKGDDKEELRRIVLAAGEAPVAVLSDEQDAVDIASAFDVGVRGFLPTTLPLDVALRALTFILNGGHFFPSSILRRASLAGGAVSRQDPADDDGDDDPPALS